MIVRMSKVEIAGPKGLLEDVVSLVRDLGVFQVEPVPEGFIEKGHEADVRSFMPDEKTLAERLFLEDLELRLDELFSLLPEVPVRRSYIDALSIINTVTGTLQRHISDCRKLNEKKEALGKEIAELNRYSLFLKAFASLLEGAGQSPGLDFIGLSIRDPAMVPRIRDLLSRITDWKFDLSTERTEDGTVVGLITIEKGLSERVKKSLSDERIPELAFPPSFVNLTFREKLDYIEKRVSAAATEIREIEKELESFSRRWLPIYRRVKEWADGRLSLLRVTASAFETRMCFVINGWMPSAELGKLRDRLSQAFAGKVAVEEKEIFEEELERVPIVLKNPPYFRPFELLVRMLPLPKYTSFDPTPFIGIFFPLFFGMILGDAGYGSLVALLSALLRRSVKRKEIKDAMTILLISCAYSIFFGILYGELFGELGRDYLGLEPLCIERRYAVLPMLLFALSIGVVHVTLGLFLGSLSALRRKMKREAIFRLLSIFFILFIVVAVVSLFGPLPWLLQKPAVTAVLILVPLLIFTGGFLAPLELLKIIGNIISYARIMAIGLASVLLAFVANRLAGMTGDIVVGVIVGGLLHVVNIILGVFSPTIHSLRLHYVEFFSKFLEQGGKRFEPLKR